MGVNFFDMSLHTLQIDTKVRQNISDETGSGRSPKAQADFQILLHNEKARARPGPKI